VNRDTDAMKWNYKGQNLQKCVYYWTRISVLVNSLSELYLVSAGLPVLKCTRNRKSCGILPVARESRCNYFVHKSRRRRRPIPNAAIKRQPSSQADDVPSQAVPTVGVVGRLLGDLRRQIVYKSFRLSPEFGCQLLRAYRRLYCYRS